MNFFCYPPDKKTYLNNIQKQKYDDWNKTLSAILSLKTLTKKLRLVLCSLQVLTSSAIDNNNIQTTPVFRIIPSIDSDVGPRASMQSTSAYFIDKTLTLHV